MLILYHGKNEKRNIQYLLKAETKPIKKPLNKYIIWYEIKDSFVIHLITRCKPKHASFRKFQRIYGTRILNIEPIISFRRIFFEKNIINTS